MRTRTGLLAAAAAVGFITIAAATELPFDMSVYLVTGLDTPTDLDATDLDGDGDLDLLVAASGDDDLRWLRNDGGSFVNLEVEADLAGARVARAADIDRDGDLDVVAGADNELAWFDNTAGDASAWTERPVDPDGLAGTRALAVGDLDDDGDPDVVAVGFAAGQLNWYENDGAQTPGWTEHSIDGALTEPGGVALADLDDDGDLDVVATSGGDDLVAWWANDLDGAGTWPETTIATPLESAEAVAVGDVDGDGDVDVLSGTSSDAGVVAWHLNDGTGGSWNSAAVYTGADASTGALRAVDVDRDGDLDTLLPRPTAGALSWFDNVDGDALTWVERTADASAPGVLGAVAVDIDEDGDIDALETTSDGQVAQQINDRIHGTATVGAETEVAQTGFVGANGLAAGDVDGDGDIDLVGTNEKNSTDQADHQVFWWENTLGDGTTWTQRTVCGPSTGTCYNRGRELDLGDLDGDGDLDLAISWFNAPSATTWFRNEGGSPVTWSFGGQIKDWGSLGGQAAEIADMDRDGDNDVVATDRGADDVGWAENLDGLGGSWGWHDIDTNVNQAQSTRAADIDGDGDPDILAVSPQDCYVGFWENLDGLGTSWSDPEVRIIDSAAASCNVSSASPADMDGDGDLDVLVAAGGTVDLVAWYENLHGDGSTWVVWEVVLLDAASAQAADLDQDGDLDVVAEVGNDVRWYENTGDPFSWPEHLASSRDPARLALADLDGDGDVDVAGNTGGSNMSAWWWRNDLERVSASTEDVAPSEVIEQAEEAVLSLTLEHRGNDADFDLELSSIAVLLEDSAGPLSTFDAGDLLASITLWADDGSGGWSASDTPLVSVDNASLALTAGVQLLAVPADPLATLAWDAGPATYFVTVELLWDAWLSGINPLHVTLLGDDVVVEPESYAAAEPTGLDDRAASVIISPLDSDGDDDPDHTDCDDSDDTIFTDAAESCDAIDSDCDGDLVDGFDDYDGDSEPDCVDLDDDGDGDPDASDCEDLNELVYTGAVESCDDEDTDCDGSLADEFDDLDGDDDPDCNDLDDDGDGDPDTADCAPMDDTIHAGADELCDAIDSDCDGSIVDEDSDFDGDLSPDCVDDDDDGDGDPDTSDCDDFNAAVYTGATESCDELDSDCDGSIVDEDPDFDGDLSPDCVDLDDDDDGDPDASDCDDFDAAVYTAAPELCDELDSDCDGSIVDEDPDFDGDLIPDCVDPDDDEDGDPDTTDCDDFDNTIYAGAPEDCDDIDSDCDGSIDDGFEDTDFDGTPDCFDEDDDGDGMPDEYELAQGFDPLENDDAEEDPDLDGRVNLVEYGDGTDPHAYEGPDAPIALQPVDTDVDTTIPELLVTNATSPVGDVLTYSFEVWGDDALTELLAVVEDVTEEDVETDWVVNETLPDDASFWWRAAADDGYVQGPWSDPAAVFVNTTDGVPADGPLFLAPVDGAELVTTSPLLVASEAVDPEGESMTYRFAVNTVDDFEVGEDLLEFEVPGDGSGQVVLSLAGEGVALDEHRTWFLQVRARDASGSSSEPDVIQVFVRGPNHPPEVPVTVTPAPGSSVGSPITVEVAALEDPEGDAVTWDLVVTGDEGRTDVLSAVTGVTGTAAEIEVALAGPAFLSVRAVDEHGATSDWSAPMALDVEADHGCQADAGGAEAAFLLVLAGPLLLRTRRRKRKGGPVPPWLMALPLLGACILPPAGDLYDGIEPGELPADGATPVDGDGDGASLVDDCDDWDPTRFPGAEEICDGVDNDCDNQLDDSEADLDSDGWLACEGDCDDTSDSIKPGAVEECDGVDENCDGVVDDAPQDPCPCAQAVRPESGASYLLCGGPTPWSDVPADCAVGYGPATLRDEGEWSFVVAAALAEGLELPWIGLSDPAGDGSWTWTDGEALDYDRWASEQPADGDCAALALPGPGSWVSVDCEAETSFVCEASP